MDGGRGCTAPRVPLVPPAVHLKMGQVTHFLLCLFLPQQQKRKCRRNPYELEDNLNIQELKNYTHCCIGWVVGIQHVSCFCSADQDPGGQTVGEGTLLPTEILKPVNEVGWQVTMDTVSLLMEVQTARRLTKNPAEFIGVPFRCIPEPSGAGGSSHPHNQEDPQGAAAGIGEGAEGADGCWFGITPFPPGDSCPSGDCSRRHHHPGGDRGQKLGVLGGAFYLTLARTGASLS